MLPGIKKVNKDKKGGLNSKAKMPETRKNMAWMGPTGHLPGLW